MAELNNTPAAAPEKKPKHWKRRILIGLLAGLLAGIAVLSVCLMLFLDWTIAAVVKNAAPLYTGTPVELKSVSINVFTGRVRLKGFKIANPQGFAHPYAFELDHFALDMDMATMLTKKIVIEEVNINGMLVDYELGLNGSNLAQIQRDVENRTGKLITEKSAAETAKEPDSDRTIIIRQFRVSEMQMAMGSVKLPLPPISMNDLGDGHCMSEVIRDFYAVLMKSVADAISNQAVQSANEVARNLGKSVEDTGKKALDSVKKMFQ